jgi:hypothetical protein
MIAALLVVLHPSHINGTFTENLTLHVDAIFSNKSLPSFASRYYALPRSLSVILGMCGVQLVRFARFCHCRKYLIHFTGKINQERNYVRKRIKCQGERLQNSTVNGDDKHEALVADDHVALLHPIANLLRIGCQRNLSIYRNNVFQEEHFLTLLLVLNEASPTPTYLVSQWSNNNTSSEKRRFNQSQRSATVLSKAVSKPLSGRRTEYAFSTYHVRYHIELPTGLNAPGDHV